VRFHRARTLFIAAILSSATILTTVVTALADSKPGPIPK
jgi:hypothetical protein